MEIRVTAPEPGQAVEVYLNLHRPGFWSIRDARSKKVIAYAESVSLVDVTFKVQAGGRRRTLEVQKEVHAWCKGIFTGADVDRPAAFRRCINYNPHKAGHFYDVNTGEAVQGATEIHMSARKVWIGN